VSDTADLIAQSFACWGEVPRIVHDVFEDIAPTAMAAALDEFCKRVLGAGLERGEFFDASVGSVHGLRLRDGRRVVVKLHGNRASAAFLVAVQAVQRHLCEKRFPAPEPLVAPTPSAEVLRPPKRSWTTASMPTPTNPRSGALWRKSSPASSRTVGRWERHTTSTITS